LVVEYQQIEGDMKNYLIAAALVAALYAPAQTRAATVNIDFSFSNPSVPDAFTGEIDGLTVGGTSSGTVYITGYTDPAPPNPYSSIYTFPTPLLIPVLNDLSTPPNSNPPRDTFTVDATGTLTAADFVGQANFSPNDSYVDLSLTYDGPGSGTNVAGLFQYIVPPSGPLDQSGGDFGNGVYTTASATPLPAALPLFATGLGAIGLFGWRKKRQNAAANAAP
jgi:hypothetical protein